MFGSDLKLGDFIMSGPLAHCSVLHWECTQSACILPTPLNEAEFHEHCLYLSVYMSHPCICLAALIVSHITLLMIPGYIDVEGELKVSIISGLKVMEESMCSK